MRFGRWRQGTQAALDQLHVKDAFAGGEKAGFRIFGKFLQREPAKVGAQLAAEGEL